MDNDYQECEQFKGMGNKFRICRGETSLDPWKVDAYRKRWGLAPIYNAEKPCAKKQENAQNFVSTKDRSLPGQAREGVHDEPKEGPGTELMTIYKEAGIPPCSRCNELATLMNKWGAKKCRDNIDYLIDDIMPRAKNWIETNKPWIHKLLPNVVEDAAIRLKLKSDIEKAISRSIENKNKLKTFITQKNPPQQRRSGGCGSCR